MTQPLLALAPGLSRVLAPNPGPMTLDGTNTWVIGRGSAAVVVVDPGPDDPAHREAVLAAASHGVAAIWLTHRHLDHSEGAAALAAATEAPVFAADPTLASVGAVLTDGFEASVDGFGLSAHATPGHTSDSVSVLLRAEDGAARLLTGDTVLGRGTTVITHPDGDVGAYLGSLQILSDLVQRHHVTEILPGHGPVITDPTAVLEHYRAHRLERLQQVREALAAGARTAAEVVDVVYADVDPSVRGAAEQSVRAQLEYLDGDHDQRDLNPD